MFAFLSYVYVLKYVNGAFEKLTGFALHEMSGQGFNLIHNLEGDQKINRKMSQGNVSHLVSFRFSLTKILAQHS